MLDLIMLLLAIQETRKAAVNIRPVASQELGTLAERLRKMNHPIASKMGTANVGTTSGTSSEKL